MNNIRMLLLSAAVFTLNVIADKKTPMNKTSSSPEFIVVAGGCFWGVEEIIRQFKGVTKVDVGYTGGFVENPTYEIVKKGSSGHAEAVRIFYDPQKVKLEEILHYFFRLHDPTTLNRQGNDVGSQYRSSIFYKSEDEKNIAEKVIKDVNGSGKLKKPTVTTLEKLNQYYLAESYHQDYLQKNPNGYTCHYLRD